MPSYIATFHTHLCRHAQPLNGGGARRPAVLSPYPGASASFLRHLYAV